MQDLARQGPPGDHGNGQKANGFSDNRKNRQQRNLRASAGSDRCHQPADDRQDDQAQNIIHHRRPQDNAGLRGVHFADVFENARCDSDAGRASVAPTNKCTYQAESGRNQ